MDELPALGAADPLGVLVFSCEEAILSLSPLEDKVGPLFFLLTKKPAILPSRLLLQQADRNLDPCILQEL